MKGTPGRPQEAAPASSRVIIKNLPKHITDVRLRSHLVSKGPSSLGPITDVRLRYTPAGHFRRFAYVGFENAADAVLAVRHFSKTYIDTSRIEVELARAVNDPLLPRPWSKYTLQKGQEEKAAVKKRQEHDDEDARMMEGRKRKFLEEIGGGEDDEDLKTYLKAMRPKSKTRTWENDNDLDEADGVEGMRTRPKKVQVQLERVPAKKTGGEGMLVSKLHVKFNDGDEHGSDEEDEDGGLYEDFNAPASANAQPAAKAEKRTDELSPDIIAETGRLFLRNLPYTSCEADLHALFEPFGPLTEVHMPLAKDTKRPKGMAYILFMLPEHAVRAYTALDGTIFQGRLLHILPGKEKPQPRVDDGGKKLSVFKAKQEAERKEMASNAFNWNSLFVRSDTVLDAIAAQLGVSKADIVGAQAHLGDAAEGSLAARLAIAETHLIQQTKAYLEAEGVQLDAFSHATSQRSDTVMLVKNIPFDTDTQELRRLFSKYGHLGRVLLPPTKTVGLVEFLEAVEARNAFRHLAYSKFKHAPLFLEWAPVAALAPIAPAAVVRIEEKPADMIEAVPEAIEEHAPSPSTLYVKNLNFDTTVDTLRRVFEAVGPIRSATIATKRHPTRPSVNLSLGFGFVEYEKTDSVNRALDELQGVVVDEHALMIKRSATVTAARRDPKDGKRKSEAVGEDAGGTKLVVRNIPFEASEKEIRALFKNFVQVRRLRLPRKFDGTHRGFGFVEFLSVSEARNAMNTLAHTHIYGRHLVLEYAKPDELGPDATTAS